LTGSKPQAEAGHPGAAGAAAVEPRAVASHPIEIEIDSDDETRTNDAGEAIYLFSKASCWAHISPHHI
jgi:hypothetical protein